MSTIQPHHLHRQAYVYLRQSTPSQVDTHRESTERQYALVDRAMVLGWDRSQVRLLDHDLGKSGTTAQGREDFHQLMAAVGELCTDLHGRGLWDASDAELLEAVWQFHRNFEAATAHRNGLRAQSGAAADGGRDPNFGSTTSQ